MIYKTSLPDATRFSQIWRFLGVCCISVTCSLCIHNKTRITRSCRTFRKDSLFPTWAVKSYLEEIPVIISYDNIYFWKTNYVQQPHRVPTFSPTLKFLNDLKGRLHFSDYSDIIWTHREWNDLEVAAMIKARCSDASFVSLRTENTWPSFMKRTMPSHSLSCSSI